MTKKIKIDIVSDVVCPWCVIGYRNLTQAISELGIEDKIELEWQPFELNPDMPPKGENLREHITRKYGSTPEDSKQFRNDMTVRGKEVGFDFNFFDEMKVVNTRDAHILLEMAHKQGKQTELKLRLFSAYFSEEKDVSNRHVLLQEAGYIGLDVSEASALLNDTQTRGEIINAETQWQQAGVSSVPTIVFNRKSALAGAQPVEAFKQALLEQLA